MRRLWLVVGVGCLLATVVPAAAEAAPKPPRVKLTISNFRFCKADSCSPLDAGYLRSNTGPVQGTDNPMATIDIKKGSVVTWTYRDAICDGISGCTGHNIYFENGGAGVKKGAVPARSGPRTITLKIAQKPGTTIRYFCTVNGHYMFGMTGILRVT